MFVAFWYVFSGSYFSGLNNTFSKNGTVNNVALPINSFPKALYGSIIISFDCFPFFGILDPVLNIIKATGNVILSWALIVLSIVFDAAFNNGPAPERANPNPNTYKFFNLGWTTPWTNLATPWLY